MSELIISRPHANIRLQLLATASALALLSVGATQAKAEDASRPTVWIEGGWQFESVTGQDDALVPPLNGLTTTGFPDTSTASNFLGQGAGGFSSFIDMERALGRSSGAEGSISFQPKGSDWIFSVAARYGRTHTKKHSLQRQDVYGEPAYITYLFGTHAKKTPHYTNYVDQGTDNTEAHTIIDFKVGRDVGLGLFGERTDSVISLGARYVQMNMASKGHSYGAPGVRFYHLKTILAGSKYYIGAWPRISSTLMERYSDLRALGPVVSWDNSTGLWGNPNDGELALDWGVNAALLFGRQKVKINYTTHAYLQHGVGYGAFNEVLASGTGHRTQSRRATVPNLGGFAGLSYRFTNAKISAGYRADFFFGAMDRGLDTPHSVTTGYNGPYATISIGFP